MKTDPVFNFDLNYLSDFSMFYRCFIFSWIPCCIKSLKDTVHSCPNCEAPVGHHRPVARQPVTRGGAGHILLSKSKNNKHKLNPRVY